MMDVFIAIVLGIVEGITEFLPVSSSAHITIIAKLFGLEEEVELYAVVTQMGAAFAIIWFFRYDILGLFIKRLAPRHSLQGFHGITIYFIATFPAVLLGLSLKPLFAYIFAPWSLALFLFLGSLFIIYVERSIVNKTPLYTTLNSISYKQAFYVGLFQCLSLFSGFSRSGATIMGSMLIGFSRPLAVRFSFILAIPILLGATLLKSITMWDDLLLNIRGISISCFVAFITSLLCIQFLLSYLERSSFIPFAIYRIIFSFILLAIIL